jgi:hypothetical protein
MERCCAVVCQPLNNTHASATEKGGKGFQVVDLADEANGVKNEALHEIFEVSVVENAAFLGKNEGDFVNNEVCLTNCEGDAENNEVRCGNFEASAKKNKARCENCKDGAVKNEVRLENFEGDFVINEDRFELEEGFFRQDYWIIRIDSCVSSSVSSVSFDSLAPALLALRANLRLLFLKGPAFSIVVNSASFGFISARDRAEFRGCLRSGWCAGGFCGRIGRRGFRRWRWGWQ